MSHGKALCVCVFLCIEADVFKWEQTQLGWSDLESDNIHQSNTTNVRISGGAESAPDRYWVVEKLGEIVTKRIINVKDFT